ncbi:MAG: OmpA family protein [Blastocatellia bacterium]|nr:OmpA family protein [Blastocatellia bacterium]
MNKLSILKAPLVLLCLILTTPVMAFDGMQDQDQNADSRSRTAQVAPGQKMKLEGVIVERGTDSFILRDLSGSEYTVQFTSATEVKEKKSNPFRGAKKYSTAQLLRGLNAEVEGRGNGSGALVAEEIKFTQDDISIALTMDAQIVPVERRLGETETRLSQTEQNAERLSGQVEELSQVANLAKGGAAAAQETADAAMDGVNRTNDRISSLDDYEVRTNTTINFRVGSAVLSADAKEQLDEFASQINNEKGFVIEVRGFASSDGSESLNRRLSQRRADAVIRYLAENHDISLRRITLPFGYGEAMPVADNSTLDGRKQNRRVELRMLVSKGIATPVNVGRPVSANNP